MTLERWLSHIQAVHYRSIDLQLDRVRRVLDRLLPNGPAFRSISVAGTNGKGTAVEALGRMLMAADNRVGCYTSPHLVRYNERVRIDAEETSDAELCSAFTEIERLRQDVPLTYFEFGTLAALLVFERSGVDIAVLEVGMGGRLDAVNAVDASAALITSISIDHEAWLGADRESIAIEKAGIFRRGRPAVCADPEPPAAVSRCAESAGAILYQLGRDFEIHEQGENWVWSGPRGNIDLAGLSLREHQARSVAGALMVLQSLDQLVPVDARQTLAGLRAMHIRGRCEVVPGNPRIILDVAHNLAALEVLRDQLVAEPIHGRTLAVCGMLQDKPVEAMADLLDPVVDQWFTGTIDDARGCSSKELGRAISGSSPKPLACHDSVLAAFRAAQRAAHAEDRIVVFGSFHTVGDILRALEGDGT